MLARDDPRRRHCVVVVVVLLWTDSPELLLLLPVSSDDSTVTNSKICKREPVDPPSRIYGGETVSKVGTLGRCDVVRENVQDEERAAGGITSPAELRVHELTIL